MAAAKRAQHKAAQSIGAILRRYEENIAQFQVT
jgi:hypothetical protein